MEPPRYYPAPSGAVHPADRAAWRGWLEGHRAREENVWLAVFKKGSHRPRMEYAEAVEEALCFGWIDSTARALDAERSMIYFAQRRPGSAWSWSNKLRIERLLAEGRMAPAGLAKIEAAKRDGSWSRLDSVEALETPPDLAEALAGFPGAASHFAAFPCSTKRKILEWIATAKRPETHARRVAEAARVADEAAKTR